MKFAELIPPILESPLLKLAERIKFAKVRDKREIRANLKLKDSAKGKRAFMIATGPSIKQEDLSVLAREDCYTISNFFLHEKLDIVNPRFHFFAPYHKPLILENYIAWLKKADDVLPESTEMVLCIKDRNLIESSDLFTNRIVHYLHFSNSPYFSNKVDLTYPILSPITGPLMMLPVLIYMGYSQIYLIGCDHTVLRDFKKTITHFYDKQSDMRQNASDVNAWEDIIESHRSSLAIFLQYQFYKKMLTKAYKNVEIINLSSDSWLDMFQTNRLKDVIKK
jgi:hypothetical protein